MAVTGAAIVVDIETLQRPLTADELDAAAKEYEPPSNYKDPKKIAKHREAYFQSVADKRKFDIDGARLISCACGIADPRTGKVEQVEVVSGEDSDEVARFFAAYVSEHERYHLVGYNLENFDLPILLIAMARAKTRLQRPVGKWDIVDLWNKPFGRKYGLKRLAAAFGMPPMDVTGASVQGLYEAGDWAKIQEYNKDDVVKTGTIYNHVRRMYEL